MQQASKTELMVAIEMITYNHDKYIEQAIESVLMQITNFNYKLIICEDCSTDNTAKICTDYRNKYPDKIDLHLNSENQGISINANKLHDLSFNSGAKYIAMLDGDDYWTDVLKLQQQVDFLEENKEYVMCSAKSNIFLEDENNLEYSFPELYHDQPFTTTHLLSHNIVSTSTALFRKECLNNEIQKKLALYHIGDYAIWLNLSLLGMGYYINKITSVYRVHKGGVFSIHDSWKRSILLLDLFMLLKGDKDFNKFKKLIINRIGKINYYLGSISIQNDKTKSRKYLLKSFNYFLLNLDLFLLLKSLFKICQTFSFGVKQAPVKKIMTIF